MGEAIGLLLGAPGGVVLVPRSVGVRFGAVSEGVRCFVAGDHPDALLLTCLIIVHGWSLAFSQPIPAAGQVLTIVEGKLMAFEHGLNPFCRDHLAQKLGTSYGCSSFIGVETVCEGLWICIHMVLFLARKNRPVCMFLSIRFFSFSLIDRFFLESVPGVRSRHTGCALVESAGGSARESSTSRPGDRFPINVLAV